jgi:hypothetical protein
MAPLDNHFLAIKPQAQVELHQFISGLVGRSSTIVPPSRSTLAPALLALSGIEKAETYSVNAPSADALQELLTPKNDGFDLDPELRDMICSATTTATTTTVSSSTPVSTTPTWRSDDCNSAPSNAVASQAAASTALQLAEQMRILQGLDILQKKRATLAVSAYELELGMFAPVTRTIGTVYQHCSYQCHSVCSIGS